MLISLDCASITVDGLKQCRFDSIRTVNLTHTVPVADIAPFMPIIFPNIVISSTASSFYEYYQKSQNSVLMKIKEHVGQRFYYVEIGGLKYTFFSLYICL